MIRSIVNCLGENGYPAVDSRNQINMTEPEKVVEFCEKVDAQEEAEITILEISYLGGFVKYDLHTKGGNVDVVRSYYKYENGNMKREVIGNYQAEYWNYTEEGYLMFSGVWFSEELYVLTLSGAEEHTALRVQPLDETYRELSRKYLRPISFERNNMFIVDWSEEDFGDLNFYDMYDILYPKVNGQYAPYVADDNLSVSAVYQIPKEEFESVIMKYFNIDSETLQSKTIYDSENLTYEYKPRGFEEVEYPEYPYSEVVGFTENNDGTITLTANVVFPYAGDSKVYAHEVVVRPLEDGGVQYVSNRLVNGAAPAHVYHDGLPGQQCNALPAEDACGVRHGGQGHHQDLRLRQHLVQLLLGQHPVIGRVPVPAAAGHAADVGGSQGLGPPGKVVLDPEDSCGYHGMSV